MDREYVQGEVVGDVGGPPKQKPRINVPPFSPQFVHAKDKAYDEADARRHAAMIAEAWRRAGHDVQPRVEYVGRGNNRRWVVRMPDLVNGLPVKALATGAKT